MKTLLTDVRHALRMFRNAPVWTVTVAGTLALGIAATTAMFSVGNAVLLRPLPFPEPERVVALWGQDLPKGLAQERVSLADFADWRARSHALGDIGYSFLWPGSRSTIVRATTSEMVHSAMVSSGWFRALGVRPVLGRIFTAGEDRRGAPLAMIVSDRLWQQQFGRDPSVLGRSLTIDSYELRTYQLVGVMPPGLQFPVDTDVWLSLGAAQFEPPAPGAGKRCCGWLEVIARLAPGVSIEQARLELNGIQRSIVAEHGSKDVNPSVTVTTLARSLTSGVRSALLILMAAVGCVLLIACVNAANLLLARSGVRAREMAIRSALGATRPRIVRQLLTESLLLAMAGGLAGMALGALALKALVAMAPNVPRLSDARPDGAFVLICAGVVVLTGIGFGLAPALQWSGSGFVHAPSAVGGPRTRLRDALVIAEVALSTALLVSGALLMRSLDRLTAVDPGFKAAGMLTASVDMTSAMYSTSARPGPNRPQVSFRRILDRVKTLPGVVEAGGANRLPLSGVIEGQGQVMATDIDPAGRSLRGDIRAVTPEYFRAMGMRVLGGRTFTEADTDQSEPIVIVDEAAARRYWPGQDPLGRRLAMINTRSNQPPQWMRVVGVVADVRHSGLDAAPRPQVYLPYLNGEWRNPYLVVRTEGDPESLASAVRKQIAAVDPNAVVTNVRSMEELVSASTEQPRFRTRLLASFSILALLLAAAGIYGVMSSIVEQRTAEIGMRMALGARASDVFRMVLGWGAALACFGLALGVGAALVVSRVMAGLLFAISPWDPLTFSASAVVLLLAAIAACCPPALRAAHVDPIVALRHKD